MHHVVQRRKDVLLEHCSVIFADRVILPNLSVKGAQILLVLDVEGLLGGSLGFLLVSRGQGPVLVDDTFEGERGLLTHIALEALVDLLDKYRKY